MRKILLLALMMLLPVFVFPKNDGYLYEVINKTICENDSTEIYELKYLYIKNCVKYNYKQTFIKDTIKIKHIKDSWICVGDTINIVIVDDSKFRFNFK